MARKITTDEKHRIRKQELFIKELNDQRKKEGKVTRFYRHSHKPEIYKATYEIIKDESDGN
jgi:hypothetical protein